MADPRHHSFMFLIITGLTIIFYTVYLYEWADHTFSVPPNSSELMTWGALMGLAVWMIGIGSYFLITRKRSRIPPASKSPEELTGTIQWK